MPLILLIRHAENDYTRKGRLAGRLPGVHLNNNGKQQASSLVEIFTDIPIKAIYSSPLERAIETAKPLAQSHQLDIVIHEGLIELDYGEWQAKSLKGLRRLKDWKTVQYTPSLMRFPQGEAILEAQCRMVQTVRQIASQYANEDWVVCVSHADPIKLAIAYFLGIPLDAYQRISIGLASISALYLDQQAARLLTLNYSAKLFEAWVKK